jgi:hypothetical protein
MEAPAAGVAAEVGSEAVGCEMAMAAAPAIAAIDKWIICFMRFDDATSLIVHGCALSLSTLGSLMLKIRGSLRGLKLDLCGPCTELELHADFPESQ